MSDAQDAFAQGLQGRASRGQWWRRREFVLAQNGIAGTAAEPVKAARRPATEPEEQRNRGLGRSPYPPPPGPRREPPPPRAEEIPGAAVVSASWAVYRGGGQIVLATVRLLRYFLPVTANPLIILLENRS